MIVPTGPTIIAIRDAPAVAAIVGAKPRGGVYAGEKPPAVEPPFVLLRELTPSRSPGGRGNGRLGLQRSLFVAMCYGAQGDSTYRDTRVLFGAVSDAIHNRGPSRDAQGRILFGSLAQGGSGPESEPGTKWVRQDLTFSVVAGAQAAA